MAKESYELKSLFFIFKGLCSSIRTLWFVFVKATTSEVPPYATFNPSEIELHNGAVAPVPVVFVDEEDRMEQTVDIPLHIFFVSLLITN